MTPMRLKLVIKYVFADKYRNLYNLEKYQYEKHLKENITKTYKKPTNKRTEKISNTAKPITEKLSIADRVPMLEETETYITIKDHKNEFPYKTLDKVLEKLVR